MENVTSETLKAIESYNEKADKLWKKVFNIREILKDVFPTNIEADSSGEYKVYTFQSDDLFKRKMLAEGMKTEFYSVYRELEKLEVEHREISESFKD
tara:strand:+ start:354 stop:644 length:291 start_codon:yes stop_codon:yes gene_type:complete